LLGHCLIVPKSYLTVRYKFSPLSNQKNLLIEGLHPT
jgi:hypothetical protein